jgi:hypothetical protein
MVPRRDGKRLERREETTGAGAGAAQMLPRICVERLSSTTSPILPRLDDEAKAVPVVPSRPARDLAHAFMFWLLIKDAARPASTEGGQC